MSSTQDNGSSNLGGGWVIPRWICWALVGTPVGGAVLVIIAVVTVGLPSLYHSVTPTDSGLLPAASRELSSALKEHQAVVRVAEVCAKDKQVVLGEPFMELDTHHPLPDAIKAGEYSDPSALPGYLDAALYLSHATAIARGQLAGKAVVDELISELFEWTIVATGLFTTILISVKAFASPRSSGYMAMAVMAIVLSSLGTGVATLNQFYTPRIEFEKTQRSLASLRTLHWTLASELLREKSACADKGTWTDWRPRHVRDLTNTFVAIMSTSMKPTAAAEDGSATPDQGDVDRRVPDPRPNRTADNEPHAK